MEKFIELLKEALEMQNQEVKKNDSFRNYKKWDSLAVLAVAAMLDEEYDITIPRSDFEKLITVGDLFTYVNLKKDGK